MPQKIIIYGESWVGTLPWLLRNDLIRRGYHVYSFDFTDILPGIRERSFYQRVQRKILYQVYVKEIQERFCKVVEEKHPDIVIIVKGLHIELTTLQIIKDCGAVIVNWNPDDFFNIKNSSESLIKSIPYFDLIVSSREHLFSKYRKNGAQQILFLDWYYVPELHYNHKLMRTIPASFVGSWSPSREEFIGRLTTEFSIWGGGWEKSSREFRRRHKVNHSILNQLEMSAVFSSSRFNLNLLTHENSDLTNLRFFEVPASGGLLLTERNDSARHYLTDGQECLMFSSAEEINSSILDRNDLDLDAIATQGQQRITAGGNTFSDRVDGLLSFLGCQL